MNLKFIQLYFFLFGICFAHAASDLPFQLQLSAEQEIHREKIEKFFKEQYAAMPPKMLGAIQGKVNIRFDHISREKFATVCPTEAEKKQKISSRPAAAVKKVRGDKFELLLHPNLIDAMVAGAENPLPGCANYPTLQQLARASTLHELAHAYDFTNQEDKAYQAKRAECENARNSEFYSGTQREECFAILAKDTSLSTHPHYLNAMGWERKGMNYRFKNAGIERKLSSGEKVTLLPRRDTYQRTDPFEHFAVNMERFLLDPEYACRLPTEYRVLQEHFNHHPHGEPKCEINTSVPYQNQAGKVNIDPARVYQVHYFLADKGQAAMSRFGHSMFRLVVCAPERKEVGPDCLKDTQHHVVVSYRMSVTDENTDYMGMIFGGKYPSRPYFLDYLETMYEYTRQEMRNVISTPINLTEEQKKNFVFHALEQYWSYSGHYAFLDNNCATESRDFLKAILPGDHAFQNVSSLTPFGLYEELVKTGLAQDVLKMDKKQTVNSTLLSESYKDRLDRAWKRLQERKAVPETMSQEQYLAQSPVERRAYFESVLNARPQEQKALAGGFFLLELHAKNFNAQNNAMKKMQQVLDHIKKERSNDPGFDKLAKILEDSISSNDPWNIVPRGYGIPKAEEMDKGLGVLGEKQRKQNEELAKLRDQLDKLLNAKFSIEMQTVENVDCVRDVMYGNIEVSDQTAKQ